MRMTNDETTPRLERAIDASGAWESSGESFDAFYAGTYPRMLGVLYALTGDRAAAEDAVQEAYARAWARWPALTVRGDPTGWIRVTAQRIAIGNWRRARTRMRAHFRHVDHHPVPDVSPDHVALVAALRRLPMPQRRAIVLFHVCDLSTREVAAELGIGEGALRVRLSRARKALGRYLGDAHMPATTGQGDSG
jgi:RNA polymerase sigma-70 factor, ECF subfamily